MRISKKLWCIRVLLVATWLPGMAMAGTAVFSTAGTTSWTAPAGVTSVEVEVWGGGGAGGGQDQNSDGGGGGGGGAYSKAVTISVVPGNTYSLTVGAGGAGDAGKTGGSGGDSFFINTTTVMAKGGTGGSPSTGTPPAGGAGGAAVDGVGAVKFSGGTGGRGRNSNTGRGGPGGSSGGTAANGTSGPDPYSVLTAAAAPVGGGIGGNGGDEGNNGFAPASGSGGGGGGSGEGSTRTGGNGADGKVVVSYFQCLPPSSVPGDVSVTCVCDTFGRPVLNPSTIFDANWSLSNSDGFSNPYIHATTGLLRLTENVGYNAKAATVPSLFPAAGNYISVEFRHYAYRGNGADGIAVTLSDYSIPAVPGGYGGSLGYAQRSGYAGFAGGWLGVALDEFGNYQNPTEGRINGPGFIVQSVGVRGPGKGASGYRWMGGTSSNPGGLSVDSTASTTPAPGYMYQVIVDARNYADGAVNVSVNRDATTKDGSTYSALFAPFNAYNEANYALSQGWIAKLVPDYWKISFTGSTGGSNNIHEIGSLRICAQTILPPTGGSASGFSAIDDDYLGAPTVPAYPNFQTGHIYMKLAGVPFQLWVAALQTTPASGISTGYSAGSNRYVQVKLVDNADNACGPDSARTCNPACTGKSAVEAGTGATQIATYLRTNATGVASPKPAFTLNSAYKNLIAVMKECTNSTCSAFTSTAPACSVDSFSVRPHALKSLGTTANNATSSGATVFKAGTDAFSLGVEADIYNLAASSVPQALTKTTSYTGRPKIGIVDTSPMGAGAWTAGSLSVGTSLAPAIAGVSDNSPTYSEVGLFRLAGYWPRTAGYLAGDDSSPRGIYDGVHAATECPSPMTIAQCDTLKLASSWTGIDSVSTENDCVQNSYSNIKVSGKYGCNFGLVADQAFGRFIPDSFVATGGIVPRSDIAACSTSSFTYLGEPFRVSGLNLTAKAAGGTSTTQNYSGAYAKLDLSSDASKIANLSVGAQHGTSPAFTNLYNALAASNRLFVAHGGTSFTDTYPATDPDCPGAKTLAWCKGKAAMSLDLTINRATTPDGPFAGTVLGISPVDDDGVKMNALDFQRNYTGTGALAADGKIIAVMAGNELRYGRLKLSNAYGSDRTSRVIPVQAQYWSGLTWARNAADSCTPIAKNAVRLTGTLSPNNTVSVDLTLNDGSANMVLNCPYATCPFTGTPSPVLAGTVGVCVDLGTDPVPGVVCSATTPAALPYLQGKWPPGTGYDNDASAQATFGIYAPETRKTVHIRELY